MIFEKSDLEKIKEWNQEILNKQECLENECGKTIHENLEDLYER